MRLRIVREKKEGGGRARPMLEFSSSNLLEPIKSFSGVKVSREMYCKVSQWREPID